MNSIEPKVVMPESGRMTIHQEAVQMTGNWIAQLPGTCPIK